MISSKQLGKIKIQEKFRQVILLWGEKSFRKLETLIGRASLVGDRPFFDSKILSWVGELEENWQTIRQELDRLLARLDYLPNFQDISPDQYSITQDNKWKTYLFYAYGLKAEKNCKHCPQTTRLIERVPGMKTAFFSILLPHKQIPEHRGPYKGVLRYHLGLKVPEPHTSCGIRVGNDLRHWQEGKSLLFDDTFPHAAWNDSDQIRVVLFLDVVRPMRFPFSLFNQFLIQLIAQSPYIQDSKKNFEEWEQYLDDVLDRA